MISSSPATWPKQVFPPTRRSTDQDVSVFTGIFGHRWVDNALENLERQSLFPVQVVMAINGRDESLVSRLMDYQIRSRHSIWVVVNETNLGPAGSFYLNRELMQGTWTVFMHQDDVYLDNHLSIMQEMAREASEATLGIFTSLGGISEDGRRRMSPPPMRNDHLRRAPSWVLVPEIIRRHPFPTPAVAVRSASGFPAIAWYDSGAPDSEWFARLACQGTIDATDDVTVLYRQPIGSESNMTDWHTRAWLWSVSIDRILNSPEFLRLLRTMPEASRENFASSLIEAIPARYPSSPIFHFMQFVAAQRMCESWDYKSDTGTDFLMSVLAQWGQSASVKSLQSLSRNPTDLRMSPFAEVLLGESPKRTWLELHARATYRRYGYLLPRRAREATLTSYKRFRGGAS